MYTKILFYSTEVSWERATQTKELVGHRRPTMERDTHKWSSVERFWRAFDVLRKLG